MSGNRWWGGGSMGGKEGGVYERRVDKEGEGVVKSRLWLKRLAPSRHRLPGGLWTTTTAWLRGWQSFQVTHVVVQGTPST